MKESIKNKQRFLEILYDMLSLFAMNSSHLSDDEFKQDSQTIAAMATALCVAAFGTEVKPNDLREAKINQRDKEQKILDSYKEEGGEA